MDIETSAVAPHSENFRFNGSGAEYFGIWIVNLLLSLLTLGLYSPWAKVRRLQYFYRNTELAGACFDYHGRPLAILYGRLLALALLLAYHFATTYVSIWTLVVLGGLALLLPWLLRSALRFRLRYSSYRGLRFDFRGSVGGAYLVFLFYPLLTFFTAYLAAPLFHQRLKQYQHGNSRFGDTAFSFDASVGRFFKIYAPFLLAFILILVLVFGAMFMISVTIKSGNKPDPQLIGAIGAVVFAIFLFGSLILVPLWQAAIQNLIWNHTALGPHRFVNRLSGWKLMGIAFSNFILVAITLGLFMPWAAVRLARYRAECLSLQVEGSIDAILAGAKPAIGAFGEETAEFFDIDIGL